MLEAMSSGLPCIATRLPGSTDVLIDDAVNGLLVKPGDENELSAAMQRIAADSDLSARLGAGARTRVIERYSIEKVAPMWLSAYRELAPS